MQERGTSTQQSHLEGQHRAQGTDFAQETHHCDAVRFLKRRKNQENVKPTPPTQQHKDCTMLGASRKRSAGGASRMRRIVTSGRRMAHPHGPLGAPAAGPQHSDQHNLWAPPRARSEQRDPMPANFQNNSEGHNLCCIVLDRGHRITHDRQ